MGGTGVETGFELIGARAAAFLVDALYAGRRGFVQPVQTLSIQGTWRGLLPNRRASLRVQKTECRIEETTRSGAV